MPGAQQAQRNREVPTFKSRTVAGAAAGNLTVTGIKKGDYLVLVQRVSDVGPDLTSEFTVTADNTINNTGGTTTAGVVSVLVIWVPRDPKIGYADTL